MTREQVLQHNANYFGITHAQAVEHYRLMSILMSEWPKELQEHCKIYASCGDSIAWNVASWLKERG